MKPTQAVLALLFLTAAALADPPKLPDRKELKPGERYKFTVRPAAAGKEIAYKAGFDENKAQVFVERLYSKNPADFNLRVEVGPLAKPGEYWYVFWSQDKNEEEASVFVVTVPGKVVPPPVDPNVDPVTPEPDPRPAPSELVAKYKTALTADEAAAPGLGLTAAGVKPHAKALAAVYGDAAAMLDINDPNTSPKTWKDLQVKLVNLSRSRQIPPPLYLEATRAVNGDWCGAYNDSEAITPEFRKKIQAKFREVSGALAEAVK